MYLNVVCVCVCAFQVFHISSFAIYCFDGFYLSLLSIENTISQLQTIHIAHVLQVDTMVYVATTYQNNFCFYPYHYCRCRFISWCCPYPIKSVYQFYDFIHYIFRSFFFTPKTIDYNGLLMSFCVCVCLSFPLFHRLINQPHHIVLTFTHATMVAVFAIYCGSSISLEM